MNSPIVAYYRGTAPDSHGRMIGDVLAWDHAQLESVHDYIQWLFPLQEASGVNPAAPVLTPRDIATFQVEARLRATLVLAFERMLDLYGLRCDLDEGAPVVRPGDRFLARRSHWLDRGNHNFLRLTRILRSLTLLGCEPHARALFACLERLYRDDPDTIGAVTFAHWARAVSNPAPIQERARP